MPARQLPRQADALQAWSSDPVGRALLLEAQAAWTERAIDAPGGQAWLRVLPEVAWPMPELVARFSDIWTLAPSGMQWTGAWRADQHALPLAASAVSRIDLRFVLEAVEAPGRLVAECARVLRPDGRLLVFGLNPWSAARLRWARHGLRALARGHVAAMLRAEGLEVLDQRTLGPRWRPRGVALGTDRAGVEFGRMAWGILAARRDAGWTPLRRPPTRWRATPGVPAA